MGWPPPQRLARLRAAESQQVSRGPTRGYQAPTRPRAPILPSPAREEISVGDRIVLPNSLATVELGGEPGRRVRAIPRARVDRGGGRRDVGLPAKLDRIGGACRKLDRGLQICRVRREDAGKASALLPPGDRAVDGDAQVLVEAGSGGTELGVATQDGSTAGAR